MSITFENVTFNGQVLSAISTAYLSKVYKKLNCTLKRCRSLHSMENQITAAMQRHIKQEIEKVLEISAHFAL